jgi:hypothetical protein
MVPDPGCMTMTAGRRMHPLWWHDQQLGVDAARPPSRGTRASRTACSRCDHGRSRRLTAGPRLARTCLGCKHPTNRKTPDDDTAACDAKQPSNRTQDHLSGLPEPDTGIVGLAAAGAAAFGQAAVARGAPGGDVAATEERRFQSSASPATPPAGVSACRHRDGAGGGRLGESFRGEAIARSTAPRVIGASPRRWSGLGCC